ncbi:HAMP domain-containing sensor histidine kinase [Flavobacterium buctense]|uniref:histidine kinase n=1 Tax=Flavobacterium buctense TaxID=1648146 RepID=A0ABU9E462_9FLAO|nr:HAMP domain-containing sensor histidine kinase [Flavobacterium buctense]
MRNLYSYPYILQDKKDVLFFDGRLTDLPKEYRKETNKKSLTEFYNKILGKGSTSEIIFGIDPLGFTYLNLDFVCYIGLITNLNEVKSKYNNLGKKYPDNKFNLLYLKKQIQFEYDLVNFKEYIPIDIVTQNLHELRGLNSKISGNIDAIMNIQNEAEWEDKFDEQSENIKKIYVGSRLIKFILDNFKFYIPDYFENLKLNYDKSFIVHRSVSKIVKIYRNDFKKDKAEIDFSGTSSGKIKGEKEYFEILVKILIENALKYSEFPKRIGPKVLIKEEAQNIIIEVHSYGRAIPESERRYLFLKGFRSSVNKASKEGTGMGLYNAKQLSKHFNGNLYFTCKDVSNDDSINLAWNIFTLKIEKSKD